MGSGLEGVGRIPCTVAKALGILYRKGDRTKPPFERQATGRPHAGYERSPVYGCSPNLVAMRFPPTLYTADVAPLYNRLISCNIPAE